MIPDVAWVPGPWPGRLGIIPRPRGGDWLEDDIRAWRRIGLEIVVSLLSGEEEEELALQDEARLAAVHGLRFVSFPIADRGVPSSVSETVALLADIRQNLEAGKTVGVHCRQGIGRSSLVAAGSLVSAGADAKEALRTVGAARGLPVPETTEQRLWFEEVLTESLALARR